MESYLFFCPGCGEIIPLGSAQPNRKLCPQCTVRKAQAELLAEDKKCRERYKAQRADYLTPVSRPLTMTQLSDALFDVKRTEQLKQCVKCAYVGGKGSGMFCDFIAHTGYTRDKGSGPGDCRSFSPVSLQPMSKSRKSVTLKY